MLFFPLQYYLIIVLPVYCISRKSLKIRSSVSQKVLHCLQPNVDSLSILPLSLIIQKMTSLGTSGRVQNRHWIKIMWRFQNFFEIYEPNNSKLATKVDLYKIYTQSGYDVTSHFRTGRFLANTHNNANRLRFDILLKNFTGGPILSFCKDFSVLRPKMTSLKKYKRLRRSRQR